MLEYLPYALEDGRMVRAPIASFEHIAGMFPFGKQVSRYAARRAILDLYPVDSPGDLGPRDVPTYRKARAAHVEWTLEQLIKQGHLVADGDTIYRAPPENTTKWVMIDGFEVPVNEKDQYVADYRHQLHAQDPAYQEKVELKRRLAALEAATS
jgi:hypothetical protein